jgi:hypothetical protein
MSQRDSQSKEIGGYRYTVSMLDPLTAEDLLVMVIGVIGPAIGAAAGALADDGGGLGEIDMGNILDAPGAPKMLEHALGSLCHRLDRQQIREAIGMLSPVTTVDINGKQPFLRDIFSAHFRGRLGAMNKWLLFAIKVQLADFFGSLGPDIGAVLQAARAEPSASTPLNTSDERPE